LGDGDKAMSASTTWHMRALFNERLKHLIHVGADSEDQVSTVFDLIVGVLVAKPAALLLVEVEGEADAGVDPTLADLAQPPYSPVLGQAVCDLCQACGVGDTGKAISPLGEEDAGPARLAGDVFVGFCIIYLNDARSPHNDAPGARQSATGDRGDPAWFSGGADGASQPRLHDLRRRRRASAFGSDCHLYRRPHPPVQPAPRTDRGSAPTDWRRPTKGYSRRPAGWWVRPSALPRRSTTASSGRRKVTTLFRRRGCEKVAPTGQFESGGRVPVACPP
jgi:hypothetical protein